MRDRNHRTSAQEATNVLGQMQDYPLALPHVFHRAEQLFAHKPIVGVGAGGTVHRTDYATWADRVRRAAAALDALHAKDEVVFVDRSLFGQFWPHFVQMETVRKVIVIDDGADVAIPDDERISDYDTLLDSVEPFEGRFEIADENQAAAMCYTSGT